MKRLIVYYSLGGNTEFAARQIAGRTDAALLRVDAARAYPDKGFRKFFWGGKSAVMAETPALAPYDFNPDDFEQVIFGFPVWAANIAPPIRSFIRENRGALAGKGLAAFACQSGSGAEKALRKLRAELKVEALDAEMILIDPKDRPAPDNEGRLRRFCEQLER